MSKILCVGDQHLDTLEPQVIERFIGEIVKTVKETSPEIVIFMGDMLHYHDTIYIDSLNNAHNLIESVSELATTFVIVGNHDMKGPTCFLDPTSHWLSSMKRGWSGVTIVDTLTTHTLNNGKKITMLPYVEPGRFIEALGGDGSGEWLNTDCIFGHQEFLGCKMGPMISTCGDKWDKKFPPVISGHIHGRQMVGTNIFYTGSSVQTSFGESSDKSICMVYFNGGTPDGGTPTRLVGSGGVVVYDIYLNMPKKKTYYKTIDDVMKKDGIVQTILKSEDDSNTTYKLTIKGKNEEFKAFKKSKKYKDIIKKGIKVVFKHAQVDVEMGVVDGGGANDNNILSFDEILNKEIKKEKNSSELYTILQDLNRT